MLRTHLCHASQCARWQSLHPSLPGLYQCICPETKDRQSTLHQALSQTTRGHCHAKPAYKPETSCSRQRHPFCPGPPTPAYLGGFGSSSLAASAPVRDSMARNFHGNKARQSSRVPPTHPSTATNRGHGHVNAGWPEAVCQPAQGRTCVGRQNTGWSGGEPRQPDLFSLVSPPIGKTIIWAFLADTEHLGLVSEHA